MVIPKPTKAQLGHKRPDRAEVSQSKILIQNFGIHRRPRIIDKNIIKPGEIVVNKRCSVTLQLHAYCYII